MASTRILVPEMLAIPGGEFRMGHDSRRADEAPSHTVRVAPFLAAVRPMSNAEYAAFLAATGREPPKFWQDPDFSHPQQPAAGITWFDAVAYCDWLTTVTGRRFRLPTEAEREFAALGGLAGGTDWPWGNADPATRLELAEVATLARPHPPTSICANGYGLMCMADNVHEWCSDWYDSAYYAASPEDSPQGPATGRRRASRGGAWRHQIKFNRCTARSSLDPTFQYNDYGFRAYADG